MDLINPDQPDRGLDMGYLYQPSCLRGRKFHGLTSENYETVSNYARSNSLEDCYRRRRSPGHVVGYRRKLEHISIPFVIVNVYVLARPSVTHLGVRS